jgi:L,D-peptidoglycan transpeptidase YkuD (ErfK/YbiS/YcfS/YnhG family)
MAKSTFYILLFQCLAAFIFSESAFGQELVSPEKNALRIAKQNAGLLDTVNQLLIVFNNKPECNLATLVAMEKKGKKWQVISGPILAGIGRKGFAAPGNKLEGDNQSPTGFFRLGQLFCYETVVDTRMPFIQTTPEDKWIDDPDSPDYNRYIRGKTSANSYEKLLLNGNDYRYCMVIEYNTHPVVKGNGSAIFLHLSEGKTINSSSGCVVLLQKDMEQLLRWIKPELKPSILMGTEKILISGLKQKNQPINID